MKKSKQTSDQNKSVQEIKINLKPKRSVWQIFKNIVRVILVVLFCFFLVVIVNSCSSCSGLSGCSDGWGIDWPKIDWPEIPNPFEDSDGNPDDDHHKGDDVDDPAKYIVFFQVTSDDVFEVYVSPGEVIGQDMPDDPVRSGYTFEGWYSAGNIPFTEDSVVTSNITVVARWSEVICDHVYVLITSVPVTTDEYGHSVSRYECLRCGEEYLHIGHVWAEDPDNEGPTTDEYGHTLEYYECTLCHDCELTFVVHEYVNGRCLICGKKECDHYFVDGVCRSCGAFEELFEGSEPEPDEPCDEHVDENGDGLCDVCGETMPEEPEPEPDEPCNEHVDENGDGLCDVCGELVLIIPWDEPCGDHVDANDDGTCDVCGWVAQDPETGESVTGYSSELVLDEFLGYVTGSGTGSSEQKRGYVYPDLRHVYFNENYLPSTIGKDYKVIFMFDSNVLPMFSDYAVCSKTNGNQTISGVDRYGNEFFTGTDYYETYRFNFAIPDEFVSEFSSRYYGFSDVTFTVYNGGRISGRYEIDGEAIYSTGISGEFSLSSDFWANSDAYAVIRIYMGVYDIAEYLPRGGTSYFRGIIDDHHYMLYVAIPCEYRIVDLGWVTEIKGIDFKRGEYSYAYVRFDQDEAETFIAQLKAGEKISVNYERHYLFEEFDSGPYTVNFITDVSGRSPSDLGIVYTVAYNDSGYLTITFGLNERALNAGINISNVILTSNFGNEAIVVLSEFMPGTEYGTVTLLVNDPDIVNNFTVYFVVGGYY